MFTKNERAELRRGNDFGELKTRRRASPGRARASNRLAGMDHAGKSQRIGRSQVTLAPARFPARPLNMEHAHQPTAVTGGSLEAAAAG